MQRPSRISDRASVALCLFAVACYGVYLIQLFESSLSFAAKYSRYMNLSQVLESLYLFGKIGVAAFAILESIALLRYVRPSALGFKRSIFYLLVFVAISNFLVYVFISYIYGYVVTIIE